jgi:hypothetical protein
MRHVVILALKPVETALKPQSLKSRETTIKPGETKTWRNRA